MTRVVIVDDHFVVLEGLVSYLERTGDFLIVGQAMNGAEALALCAKFRPEIAIVDLGLEDISGAEVLRRLVRDGSSIKVVILSGNDSASQINKCMEYGAHAFVLKHSYPRILEEALNQVLLDRIFIDPSALEAVQLLKKHREFSADGEDIPTLTPKETEVLNLLAEGYATSEMMAHRQKVTMNTINKQIASLKAKFGVHNRPELIYRAIELGFIKPKIKYQN